MRAEELVMDSVPTFKDETKLDSAESNQSENTLIVRAPVSSGELES